jgi:2-keto-4-pentenoate hydratase/2-oxohepta-3-ene-1,7-dioic acid hydratase in catechol pathway
MKMRQLVTFIEPYYRRARLGILSAGSVTDANLASAARWQARGALDGYREADARMPPSMMEYLRLGEAGLAELTAVFEFIGSADSVSGPRGETIRFPQSAVKVLAPVPRPGKIIHTAGNFREHAREGTASGWKFQIPPWISFLKSTSAIIGHEDDIVCPRITLKLDHEIELAIIIGKAGRYIPAEKAWEHIAGFTVFNDVTARDLQHREMRSGLLNLGKNLDSFAPFGPAMTLRDEIGDVHNLKIELRLNGDPRQVSSTSRLAVKVPEIVSHWSVLRLEPGDIITTGTVSGVAAFRKPDPSAYWMKPGDVCEAEIENIGILRNRLVADVLTEDQERWLEARRHLFEREQADETRAATQS